MLHDSGAYFQLAGWYIYIILNHELGLELIDILFWNYYFGFPLFMLWIMSILIFISDFASACEFQ